MNHCLVRQDFDSEAFGLPFFRLARLDPDLLGGEMRRIARLPGALADARLPAAAIAGAALLQRHGFRKVGEYFFPVGAHQDHEFILRR